MTTTDSRPGALPPGPEAEADAPMTHREILEALTGLLAALFTAMLSSTIVSTALPTIIGDLNGTQTQYAWVITTALLANAASTPIWGKFADLFNKKLLVQLVDRHLRGRFGASPASRTTCRCCSAARVVQGIGMGGLTALVVAIIGTHHPAARTRPLLRLHGCGHGRRDVGRTRPRRRHRRQPLGWRWCFFVCVPIAVDRAVPAAADPARRRPCASENVNIDWLGADPDHRRRVSVLLIWVSFAGKADYYEWISARIGAVRRRRRGAARSRRCSSNPKVKPTRSSRSKIVTERTTALAIIASIAVGVGHVRRDHLPRPVLPDRSRIQPHRSRTAHHPDGGGHARRLDRSGQLITRFGKWKRSSSSARCGPASSASRCSATIDHATNLWLVGSATSRIVGLGVGMLMQNLVLAVQNTVSVHNIGAASQHRRVLPHLRWRDRRLGPGLDPGVASRHDLGGRIREARHRCRGRRRRQPGPECAARARRRDRAARLR